MPNYGTIVQLSRTLTTPLGITVDGDAVEAPTFAVKRSNNADISGRPGLIVELLVDGSPPDKSATVAGVIPVEGTICRVGNASHRLREPLNFVGGDQPLGDYWYSANAFGQTRVEPVLGDDPSKVRDALRRAACIDLASAFVVAAPSNTKGTSGSISGGTPPALRIEGAAFDAAFEPRSRSGVPQDATVNTTRVDRMTVGVNIPRFAPYGGNTPVGWSAASRPFFPAAPSGTIVNFATGGYTLDPGVAVAVFDDALTENWADATAVSFLITDGISHWAAPLDDAISQRLVEEESATSVESVQSGAWEIESPIIPTGELLTDEHGRVWTIEGFEALGDYRWRIEGTRVLGGGAE